MMSGCGDGQGPGGIYIPFARSSTCENYMNFSVFNGTICKYCVARDFLKRPLFGILESVSASATDEIEVCCWGKLV